MKNTLRIPVALIFLLQSFLVFAQLPVSTLPHNRKVLIEHYYGFRCYWSPQADTIADAIKAMNAPGAVEAVNIHCVTGAGGWANPSPGWPDYQTADGAQIYSIPGMATGVIPAGPVNRRAWSPPSTSLTISRYEWAAKSNIILGMPSYVNVAIEGSLNVATRVLTATVEVYYTGNSPAGTNSLTVELLEDKVLGPQAPGFYNSNYNSSGMYNHNNMLRKCLTPPWGATIPTTTAGSFYTTTYSYVVPATYGVGSYTNIPALQNMRVIAFVAESTREVQTVASGQLHLTGFTYSADAGISDLNLPLNACSEISFLKFKLHNNCGAILNNALFSISVDGNPPTQHVWTGTINPLNPAQTVTFNNIPGLSQAVQSHTVNISLVSINSVPDQNSSNNYLQTLNLLHTTTTATGTFMVMHFWQDQKGQETKWEVYEENTNILVASDGPWTQLPAPGITMNYASFTVMPGKCYRLVVTDAGGNGIANSYGIGYYRLYCDGNVRINGNGNFGSGEIQTFRTVDITGVSTNEREADIEIYPNPAENSFSISYKNEMAQLNQLSINNSVGVKVFFQDNFSSIRGENEIVINTENWAPGIYVATLNTHEGIINKRLVVQR